MTSDPTGAERQRRYRERRAKRLPAPERPTCAACGKRHTGAHGILCCRCWERLDPEGQARRAARVARAEARKRQR